MKKVLFTLAIASAFLTSCNNDYYVPLPEEANNLIGTKWECEHYSTLNGKDTKRTLYFITNREVVSSTTYTDGSPLEYEFDGKTYKVDKIDADTLDYLRFGTLDHKEDELSICNGYDTLADFYPNMNNGVIRQFMRGTDTNLFPTPELEYKRIK